MENSKINFDSVIEFYRDEHTQFILEQFMKQIKIFFELNPKFHSPPFPIVHSLKSRLKDAERLRDKLQRKAEEGNIITEESLLCEITDLAGVRVLHLYHDQFEIIHTQIMEKINKGDWILGESPKAYTWDPDTQSLFRSAGVATEIRDSYYTSVHYLIKPNNSNDICCEVQVRTLFEEIWGEIDHAINYPHKTKSVACAEQLKVLSKLVSTGTRLSDSIFRSHSEYISQRVEDDALIEEKQNADI